MRSQAFPFVGTVQLGEKILDMPKLVIKARETTLMSTASCLPKLLHFQVLFVQPHVHDELAQSPRVHFQLLQLLFFGDDKLVLCSSHLRSRRYIMVVVLGWRVGSSFYLNNKFSISVHFNQDISETGSC